MEEQINPLSNMIGLLERTLQNFLLYVDGDYITKIGGKFMVQTTADGEFGEFTEEGVKVMGFDKRQYLGQIYAVSLAGQGTRLFISAYVSPNDPSTFIHVTVPIEWLLKNHYNNVPHFAFINHDRLILNYAISLTETHESTKLGAAADALADIKLSWTGIEKESTVKP